MCDYSLMGIPNRLANEGEDLVVYQFSTGSRGFAPDTPDTPDTSVTLTSRSVVKKLLGSLAPEKVAVCVPPGARLLLGDIPEDVQKSLGVAESEEVTFTQLTATPRTYRDAVRFKNGHELLLQRLNKGQRVRVLQLSLTEEPVRSDSKAAELVRL